MVRPDGEAEVIGMAQEGADWADILRACAGHARDYAETMLPVNGREYAELVLSWGAVLVSAARMFHPDSPR